MLSWIRESAADRRTAKALHGAIVAQALDPEFFGERGADDTPDGRLGVIMAHIFPVLDRLSEEGGRGRRLARFLSEAHVTYLDDCLREIGIGDLAVPRKVKGAAGALSVRCRSYREALRAGGADGLRSALETSIPGMQDHREGAGRLARRLRATRNELAGLPLDTLIAGPLRFAPAG